jgi:polyphosphate kinase
MIAHLLSTVPYFEVQRPPIEFPARPAGTTYERPPRELFRSVPDHAAGLAHGRAT